MARIFIGFMICFLFLNCSKKENLKKNTPYIISQENKEKINGNDTIPAPPPIPGDLFYGTDTFIISSDTTVCYLRRNSLIFICGNIDSSDTIPYFINLQPRDLIGLSNKNLSDFIKLNYRDDFRHITFIASPSDTIKSKAFFDLHTSLNSLLKYRDRLIVRRTTQEEDTVLKYKKNNEYYNSEDIKWDKNRITFPFIKPKLEKIKE